MNVQREHSVLVVEDDAMVRGWIRLALRDSDFRVVGEAETAAQGVELVLRKRPDVLIVDYRLPDGVGTELVKELRLRGNRTPAVVMTAHAERGFNEAVRQAGAQGSTLKTGASGELEAVLSAVVAGRSAFDVRHPHRAAHESPLSPREREVLALVAGGATNREAAASLGVTDETVKTLVSRTYTKLGVRRRAEAVSRAHDLGLL